MELFLNLCWLALALPAYVLWRRRISSEPWTRASFVIICTLGCALVLLFPVVSASDDLHAISQPVEESERSFRHIAHGAGASHVVHHVSPVDLPATASLQGLVERVDAVVLFAPHASLADAGSVSISRAPPCHPVLFV